MKIGYNFRMFFAYVLMAVALLWFVGGSYYYLKRPYPEPEKVKVYVPEGAEVRSWKEITPGTFKIKVSQEEFEGLKGGRIIVAYDPKVVEYWMPRNDGVFYYTISLLPFRHWPFGFGDGEVNFDAKSSQLIVYSQRDYLTAFFIIFVLGIATCCLGVFVHPAKQNQGKCHFK